MSGAISEQQTVLCRDSALLHPTQVSCIFNESEHISAHSCEMSSCGYVINKDRGTSEHSILFQIGRIGHRNIWNYIARFTLDQREHRISTCRFDRCSRSASMFFGQKPSTGINFSGSIKIRR